MVVVVAVVVCGGCCCGCRELQLLQVQMVLQAEFVLLRGYGCCCRCCCCGTREQLLDVVLLVTVLVVVAVVAVAAAVILALNAIVVVVVVVVAVVDLVLRNALVVELCGQLLQHPQLEYWLPADRTLDALRLYLEVDVGAEAVVAEVVSTVGLHLRVVVVRVSRLDDNLVEVLEADRTVGHCALSLHLALGLTGQFTGCCELLFREHLLLFLLLLLCSFCLCCLR